jgi:hypothetical protein
VTGVDAKYVVDENGERVSVLLDWEDYRHLMEELEELESVHAYDAAKGSGDEVIPFEGAVEEVENKRGKDHPWGAGVVLVGGLASWREGGGGGPGCRPCTGVRERRRGNPVPEQVLRWRPRER